MMNQLPIFLNGLKNKTKVARFNTDLGDSYHPLIASWLLELTLLLKWHKKSILGEYIFESDDFSELTGIDYEIDFSSGHSQIKLPTSEEKINCSDKACRNIVKQRLLEINQESLEDKLSIFKNIDVIGRLLGLADAGKAILAYAVILEAFPKFKNIIASRQQKSSTQNFVQIMGHLLGYSETVIRAELNANSPLIAGGLIGIDTSVCDLEDKINVTDGLSSIISQPHVHETMLLERFLRKTSPTNLILSDFPHLIQEIDALKKYIGNAVKQKETGVNVLIYGIPGTGKTEFIKALSNALGTDLYEIAFSSPDGEPISGKSRISSYNLCQRLLRNQTNALLMFDEIEDIFNSIGLLSGDDDKRPQSNKAWINRILERNETPAFWVTNDAAIDPAYLRRFDYSVKFTIPPKSVRLNIVKRYLGQLNVTEDWLNGIASNEHLSPSQYENAAKLVRVSGESTSQTAGLLVEQSLQKSASLLGQHRLPLRNTVHTQYNLDFINTNICIDKVITGLKSNPSGTFCFYGPAGTGKSELARHIADEINMPVIVKRASDVLGMWLGETEKNIAEMFFEARQQCALLVLDEADSFLADRRDAQHSWEVSQVNEFLTQIEAFEGIFVCTTNLMDKLDQASLRRFSFKVKFDYLTSDQRWSMFNAELTRLGNGEVSTASYEKPVRRLENLTPGDFSVVARKVSLIKELANPKEFYESLVLECQNKEGVKTRIGFEC